MKELSGFRYEVCAADGSYRLGDIYDTEKQARDVANKECKGRTLLVVKMTWHRELDDDGHFSASVTHRTVVDKITPETH